MRLLSKLFLENGLFRNSQFNSFIIIAFTILIPFLSLIIFIAGCTRVRTCCDFPFGKINGWRSKGTRCVSFQKSFVILVRQISLFILNLKFFSSFFKVFSSYYHASMPTLVLTYVHVHMMFHLKN